MTKHSTISNIHGVVIDMLVEDGITTYTLGTVIGIDVGTGLHARSGFEGLFEGFVVREVLSEDAFMAALTRIRSSV